MEDIRKNYNKNKQFNKGTNDLIAFVESIRNLTDETFTDLVGAHLLTLIKRLKKKFKKK